MIYIETLDCTILVKADHFALQANKREAPDESVKDAVVRLVATGVGLTPRPRPDSRLLKLNRDQLITTIAIGATVVSSLRLNRCEMGVFGRLAFWSSPDADNNFWISDLKTLALIDVNMRVLAGHRVLVNDRFNDRSFFDLLASFLEVQVEAGHLRFDFQQIEP